MKYEIRRNTLIVYINGEIDDFSVRGIRSKLDYILLRKEIKNLIFDLSRMTFMDSAGIGLLVGRYRFVKEKKGVCALIVQTPRVKQILKMSGLLSLFTCFDNLDDAVEELCDKVII